MVDDGVIGYIAATSVKAYDTYAAAVFPSIVLVFLLTIFYLLIPHLIYHVAHFVELQSYLEKSMLIKKKLPSL
jgi:succinate dehydrogenase/fumarate reductase cytochrome b subunit